MKLPRAFVLSSVLIAWGLVPGSVFAAPRVEVSLNAGWRFHFSETSGAEAASFDASSWTTVDIPHTWNALDGQDGVKTPAGGANFLKGGDYARGSGWYRRVIKAAPEWTGRQVYVQFDGANRRADVFLNGQFVGTHLGGNARFRFDLTGELKREGDNLLAVRVNNDDNGLAPHSGDFTFFGGLYRDVSLLVTDAIQIETLDHASSGVFLSQSNVTVEHAEVNARVELANHEANPVEVLVHIGHKRNKNYAGHFFDAAKDKLRAETVEELVLAAGSAKTSQPEFGFMKHLVRLTQEKLSPDYFQMLRVEASRRMIEQQPQSEVEKSG